ncbi:hypothetical protein B6A27_01205 [Anoxybacillus sp. UARK-01]|nr:hypothetical protein B6A27_01205 [Anoxybacillus sp. UARK-01]
MPAYDESPYSIFLLKGAYVYLYGLIIFKRLNELVSIGFPFELIIYIDMKFRVFFVGSRQVSILLKNRLIFWSEQFIQPFPIDQ